MNKSKSSSTSFYQNNKLVVFMIAIIVVLLVIKVMDNRNSSVPKKEDIEISIEPRENVSVGIGNTINLKAVINIDNAVINWTSSDNSIAKVNGGNVTGISYGNARITAFYIDNSGNKHDASCLVSVIEGNPNVSLNNAYFPDGDLYMPLDDEYYLTLILSPSNALVNEKTFISTNPNVASVTEDGVVRSINSGHTKIIVTVNNRFTASINVYVGNEYRRGEIVLSPTSLSFDSTTRKIKNGNSETISYSISPSNADRSKLVWSSSDSNVVSVDENGRITAKKVGKATISISSINGKRDDMLVEVYNDIVEVKEILVSTSTITMEAGKTTILTPVVRPDNASNKGLSFSSSDPSIVSISSNSSGTEATLSALKKGKAVVTIRSGNIYKQVTVDVKGNENKSKINDETIEVTSNKNNLAISYEDAVKIPVPGKTIISIKMGEGVGKIEYCIHEYGTKVCTPTEEIHADDSIVIPNGNIYVLRIIKYDYENNKLPSGGENYVNGVLNYYINTESEERTNLYTIRGVYDTLSEATLSPSSLYSRVMISLDDRTRHLYVCATTSTTCTPNTRVNDSYSITLNASGTWRIYVIEYDSNNVKIGNTEVYYAYVKGSITPSPTPISDTIVNASNVKVYTDTTNGRYLSVDVTSDINFYTTRFCYTVVDKGSYGTCDLDITSKEVEYYNNGRIVTPKEMLTTYYATLTGTTKYTFKFYLPELDYLYDNFDTTKDVIFEFSVKSSKGYSNPIRIKINMTNRSGNNSYWSSSIIK